MDPAESTVGYPVVFRSEGDVRAAAFVRAVAEPRLSPRVLVVGPWVQIFVVFWPVFLGLCMLYCGFLGPLIKYRWKKKPTYLLCIYIYIYIFVFFLVQLIFLQFCFISFFVSCQIQAVHKLNV